MSSKHPYALQLIRRGLYDDLQSFAQLEQRISALSAENTKFVGDAFEIFVEGYLATHQKLQADKVWLVGQLPLPVRQQLNLPSDAKGIDGVFRTRTGTLVPYQVKFRSRRAYLTFTEVAPFLGLTERATDRIIFTNSNDVADDAKNRDAMRTVRGIDFDDLTADELHAISGWLKQQPIPIPKLRPHPYQVRALSDIAETLTRSDRAHVVMACGTGKTLAALWAVEQLKPKTVLVLVPSLTLLQQTLDEWSRQNNWGTEFTYLCVCSDPTVVSRDEYDPVQMQAMDLEFRVDTDPSEVRRFIEQDTSNIQVIFSTYHSSPIVSEGVRGLAPLDVAIFDEAHKTTGPTGGSFAHALFQENMAIHKRLFFTATPRHYDIRHRNREDDFKLQSMDDPAIYGPRAHTLTFGSAARQGIICNYKVVISVVDGQEVNDFVLKHGITLVEGDLISAKWVANEIAVERAVQRTGAKHIITFHSRVSSAKEFTTDTARGIKQYLPEFSVFHVNGSQHSSERKQIIRAFREARCSIITNARCLTEGIDVPAVDMVAFIDPRHSKIDIAQATGRAMRRPRGSDKTHGYIVVPLFLERDGDEPLEQALERSDFADVADVLNALQEQDEDLIDIIRELQEAKGRGELFKPKQLADKIEIIGPTIDLSELKTNIFAEIVHAIGTSWDEMFGRLLLFRNTHQHCRVPPSHPDKKLVKWVSHQRGFARNGSLSSSRKQRLDSIGFEWAPHERAWEVGFRDLKSYQERCGHCRVPLDHIEDGFQLGAWAHSQRQRKKSMSKDRRQRLDQLGFVWGLYETDWEMGFNCLKAYKERNGHCRVPVSHKENGFNLGHWVNNQRRLKAEIPVERRQRLDTLGFIWDVNEADWEEGLSHLRNYKNREGHCRVPQKYTADGFRLGIWVAIQRRERESMGEQRRRKLDELGFIWDVNEADWEEGYTHLKRYKDREGHCRIPLDHEEDGFRLGGWVRTQRVNRHRLPPERRRRLEALGFVWDPFQSDWEDGLRHLRSYKNREGHCRVPAKHNEGGFQLGQWVSNRRGNRDSLSDEQRRQLDEHGFDWDPFQSDWEEGYSYLKRFKDREGHCRVPLSYEENEFRLGLWARGQRRDKDQMSEERRQRLDQLEFVWDPAEWAWEQGLSHLKSYRDREGHCRVPKNHIEADFRLGQWVASQRATAATLSKQRRQRLDALGFVWDPFQSDWEEGYSYLRCYKDREGHCRVPMSHQEDGFKLGQWVSTQRAKASSLSKERRRLLEQLGFDWRLR